MKPPEACRTSDLRKSVEVVVISNAVADFADLTCVLAGSKLSEKHHKQSTNQALRKAGF